MSEHIIKTEISNGALFIPYQSKLSESVREEIVRCRDCRHFEEIEGMFKWCSFHNMDVKEHDFCSKGKRRDADRQ